MPIDRRGFLKAAGAGAGLTLAGARPEAVEAAPRRAPLVRSGQASDVVVVGAGSFGAWTSLHLQRMGATVTLVDQYGPANSRSTSGGETRGVRSSYGDRPQGLQWGQWAVEAMRRWKAWDEEHARDLLPPLFFTTGDVILRAEMEPFLEQTVENWKVMGHEHEIIDADEVRRRWPVIATDEMQVAIYEPSAGVVRARRAIESVAQVFQREGGTIKIGRATLGANQNGTLSEIVLDSGERVTGDTFVFALGPWFPKVFPEQMGRRIRASTLGHVLYIATPPGDHSYEWPNLPSYNVPGCTGWPALPPDFRGFRIRVGGHSEEDPDTSSRWVPLDAQERPREILRTYFPALAELPINETRACHYEGSVSRNFIIDRQPGSENVWFAGGGNAEAFKQGPVLGEYIAGRVMGTETDPELIEAFKFPEEEYDLEEERRREEARRRRGED
ncbi:MAG: FAD-dependent oxidoreductase [Gemmatimonadota bacterium]